MIVVCCEFVDTNDGEYTTIGNEFLVWMNFIAGKISVTNELLTWLIDAEGFRELLSSQVHRE